MPIPDLLAASMGSGVFAIVAIVILCLAVLAALACLSLVVHHIVTQIRWSRHQTRMRRVGEQLAPNLASGTGLVEAAAVLREEYGRLAVVQVLRRARTEVRGVVRERISEALEELGEVDRLRKRAHSRRLRRRLDSIRGLGECGGDTAREVLSDATRDPLPEVRRAARDGLLSEGHTESIRVAIASYLEDYPKLTGWRGTFFGRLAVIAPDQIREMLGAGGLPERQEKLALEALGDAGVAEVAEIARGYLSADNPELRATAARILGKVRDAESRRKLLELLDDEQWFVRAAAARALERIPVADDGVEMLSDRLTDPKWWVRSNAARALAYHGPDGVRHLVDAVEGEDPYARDAAVSALSLAAPVDQVRRHLDRILEQVEEEQDRLTLVAALSYREEKLA